MPNNFDAMQLLVQLKILKELRILNKTLTKGLGLLHGYPIERQEVLRRDLEDVEEVMSAIGHLYV